MEKIIKINFVVEEKIYSNEKTNFAVLNGTSNNLGLVVVGPLFGVDEGEILTLFGNYVYDKVYGEQFKAVRFKRGLPNTKRAIVKFLASARIRGLREKTAEKIVEHFGEDSLNVLENDLERLNEVRGIGGFLLNRLKKDLKNFLALKRLSIFLQQFDISSAVCLKIWGIWGIFSQSKIKSNPYCLCSREIGVSFNIAEKIGKFQKISDYDENRVLAAVESILYHNALENGHSCVPKQSLIQVVSRFLKMSEEEVEEFLKKFVKNSKLYIYRTKKDFIFLPVYYLTERYIAKRLVDFKSFFKKMEDEDFNNLIILEQERLGIQFAKTQKQAIRHALENAVFVLTGGPGTGKTTILTAVVSILEQSGLDVAVCAPTGKAAKRLEAVTTKKATTIHRLLGVQQTGENTREFVHSQRNLLKCDAVIVDEMSMVDCMLFCSLLKALKNGCRLIMSGDFNQLPCISAGNVLKNILASNVIAFIELTSIFRQSRKSLIVTNAHNIISEKKLTYNVRGGDFFFIEKNRPIDVLKATISLIKNKLTNVFGKEALVQKLQVICPCKKGIVGTIELNRQLQEILNPNLKNKKEFRFGFYVFREGDRLLQTKNNYDVVWEKSGEKGQGIFNGEIGTILEINTKQGNFVMDFDGKICNLDLGLAKELEPAWAITVHKSQGSEFPCVVMPFFFAGGEFFSRNLLYTAITRAQQLIVLIGSGKNLEDMCRQKKVNFRYSLLKEFLNSQDCD